MGVAILNDIVYQGDVEEDNISWYFGFLNTA